MEDNIRVSIDDLLEKLNDMVRDEYTTVELRLNLSDFIENSSLTLFAIDSINEREVEYGDVNYDSGEL